MRLGYILAITVILAGCAGMNAGVQDGQHAYERGAYDEAVVSWQPLAERGNPEAQAHLAQLYVEHQGVPRDYVRAYMWYSLAAERGLQGAQTARKELERRMNFAQVSEAERMAAAWRHRHPFRFFY